jgi:hypothetical protein
MEYGLRYTFAMTRTVPARINADGSIQLHEPVHVNGPHRATVTIFEDEPGMRSRSKHWVAFSSGHADTSERVDELLDELGIAGRT